MEALGAFGLVVFVVSLVCGTICFFYLLKTLFSKKIAIKTISESLGEAAGDKSVIALVAIILCVLGISFLAICLSLFLFASQN